MSEKEIVGKYVDMTYIIDTHGIDEFKKMIEENKNKMTINELTIASSIIAVFDMIEKKEKKWFLSMGL